MSGGRPQKPATGRRRSMPKSGSRQPRCISLRTGRRNAMLENESRGRRVRRTRAWTAPCRPCYMASRNTKSNRHDAPGSAGELTSAVTKASAMKPRKFPSCCHRRLLARAGKYQQASSKECPKERVKCRILRTIAEKQQVLLAIPAVDMSGQRAPADIRQGPVDAYGALRMPPPVSKKHK